MTLCLALALAALGQWLGAAWGATARREAYLPQLEAQARLSLNDGPLLALLGARLAEAHEQQAAADALRRSVAAGEQQEVIFQTLAASLAAQGERVRALNDLRFGQRSLPGGAPALDAALARVQALGPNPDAAELAQAICPDGPAPLSAAYTQGSVLNALVSWWGRHHPDRSGFATRQEWAWKEPSNAQAQRLWGLALMANHRLPEAGVVLANAAALAPRSPATHLALARVLEAGGLTSKAGLEYINALNLRPDWPPALLGLGQNSQQAGLKYARQAFARATQVAPDSASAWAGLGRACLKNDSDLSQSLRAFQTAARLNSSRTDFDADYAEALRKNGRSSEAEARLRRCLAADPDDAVAHYRLGTLLMENTPSTTRMSEAEKQTGEAVRLLPHQAGAERQLGTILLDGGHLPAALRVTQAAVADDPYEVQARHVLAQIYGRLGRSAKAQQVSARAAQLFSLQQQANVLENQREQRFLEPAYHQNLVHVYQLTGQFAKAAQEEQMLSLLRRDQQGAARSYRDYQASLARALGTSVRN
jgi:predicted Zn-dependent protease